MQLSRKLLAICGGLTLVMGAVFADESYLFETSDQPTATAPKDNSLQWQRQAIANAKAAQAAKAVAVAEAPPVPPGAAASTSSSQSPLTNAIRKRLRERYPDKVIPLPSQMKAAAAAAIIATTARSTSTTALAS